MSEAECLKILLAHKKQGNVADRDCRRRVCSPIEDGQLSNRTAWTINTEYLFASGGGAFEDADIPGLNHIKPRARLAFAKHHLARRVVAGNRPLG